MDNRTFWIRFSILGLIVAFLGTAYNNNSHLTKSASASSESYSQPVVSPPWFVASSQSLEAADSTVYILSIESKGEGTVSKSPHRGRYLSGSRVELTAHPVDGWHFSNWSGDLSGDLNPAILLMDADKYVIAEFSHKTYSLSVVIDGSGTVTRDPDRSDYRYGERVTLTANAELGWSFDGWSGDLSGGTNPVTIRMDGYKTVTAIFSQSAPTGILLSNQFVPENQPAGTTVGMLSTVDPNIADSHTYSLTPGIGDGGNGSFRIEGQTLKTNAVFDFEAKNSYQIRVRTTDSTGLSFEKEFAISITDENEAPEALGDPYSIAMGGTLTIDAPGVLENDADSDGDELAAILVSMPEHTALFELSQDGSFVYQPEDSFIGVDTFTYKAFDGALYSEVVTVEIDVFDVQSPQVEWVSPVSNGSVYDAGSEPVLLEVQAQDDTAVQMVRFYRWDAIEEAFLDIGFVDTAPYRMEIDPGSLNPGWNQIFARAFDITGNESGRTWIWLRLKPAFSLFLPGAYR